MFCFFVHLNFTLYCSTACNYTRQKCNFLSWVCFTLKALNDQIKYINKEWTQRKHSSGNISSLLCSSSVTLFKSCCVNCSIEEQRCCNRRPVTADSTYLNYGSYTFIAHITFTGYRQQQIKSAFVSRSYPAVHNVMQSIQWQTIAM